MDEPTDRPTDQRIDRRTGRRMDGWTYAMHLLFNVGWWKIGRNGNIEPTADIAIDNDNRQLTGRLAWVWVRS